MAGFKNQRITSDIMRELSALIAKLKDPRVSKFTSIVKVDVSGDLSYVKVYISTLEGGDTTAQTVKGLKSASGFLKRELSHTLKLRKTPELKFIKDDSLEISANISEIISNFTYNEDNHYGEDEE